MDEQEDFLVDNDQKAEWALIKIKEIDSEYERLSNVCALQIDFYKSQQKQYEEKKSNDRCNLVSMLSQYFENVTSKETKTQATYKLPSGKLVKKLEKREFTHDPEKLLEVLANTEFVEKKPSLKWGEFKKTLQIVGDHAVDESGEIVEGVTVAVKPASFDVEV
jgi:hypothetical protein